MLTSIKMLKCLCQIYFSASVHDGLLCSKCGITAGLCC